MASFESSNVLTAVESFKTLAEIPSVSSAEIYRCPDEEASFEVGLSLSARSYATLARTNQKIGLKIASNEVVSYVCSPSIDVADDTIKAKFTSSTSQGGCRYTVVLRETAKDKKRSVELWRKERRVKYVDVSSCHGEFNTTGESLVF
jgi:hypothetical protein